MRKEHPAIVEDGIIAGNYSEKYNTRNLVAKKLMAGFESSVFNLVLRCKATSIHEVGCGEGHLASKLNRLPGIENVRGSDFSSKVIDLAKDMHGPEGIAFKAESIYDLDSSIDMAELIVCCEVLEHLEDPERSLAVLRKLASPYCLISVPREPIWRLMNMVRGKYLRDYGNTPGHVQHWSKYTFIQMVSKFFRIKAVETPLPWIVCLCRRIT